MAAPVQSGGASGGDGMLLGYREVDRMLVDIFAAAGTDELTVPVFKDALQQRPQLQAFVLAAANDDFQFLMERVTNEGRVQLGPLLRYLEPNAWKARMRTPTGTDNLEVAANLSAQHGMNVRVEPTPKLYTYAAGEHHLVSKHLGCMIAINMFRACEASCEVVHSSNQGMSPQEALPLLQRHDDTLVVELPVICDYARQRGRDIDADLSSADVALVANVSQAVFGTLLPILMHDLWTGEANEAAAGLQLYLNDTYAFPLNHFLCWRYRDRAHRQCQRLLLTEEVTVSKLDRLFKQQVSSIAALLEARTGPYFCGDSVCSADIIVGSLYEYCLKLPHRSGLRQAVISDGCLKVDSDVVFETGGCLREDMRFVRLIRPAAMSAEEKGQVADLLEARIPLFRHPSHAQPVRAAEYSQHYECKVCGFNQINEKERRRWYADALHQQPGVPKAICELCMRGVYDVVQAARPVLEAGEWVPFHGFRDQVGYIERIDAAMRSGALPWRGDTKRVICLSMHGIKVEAEPNLISRMGSIASAVKHNNQSGFTMDFRSVFSMNFLDDDPNFIVTVLEGDAQRGGYCHVFSAANAEVSSLLVDLFFHVVDELYSSTVMMALDDCIAAGAEGRLTMEQAVLNQLSPDDDLTLGQRVFVKAKGPASAQRMGHRPPNFSRSESESEDSDTGEQEVAAGRQAGRHSRTDRASESEDSDEDTSRGPIDEESDDDEQLAELDSLGLAEGQEDEEMMSAVEVGKMRRIKSRMRPGAGGAKTPRRSDKRSKDDDGNEEAAPLPPDGPQSIFDLFGLNEPQHVEPTTGVVLRRPKNNNLHGKRRSSMDRWTMMDIAEQARPGPVRALPAHIETIPDESEEESEASMPRPAPPRPMGVKVLPTQAMPRAHAPVEPPSTQAAARVQELMQDIHQRLPDKVRPFGLAIRDYRQNRDVKMLADTLLAIFPAQHRHLIHKLESMLPPEHRQWFNRMVKRAEEEDSE
ncbi:uncharacterized protein MONBRDRAFT_33709 [Monosiga brevicollis MX1]|uniref:Mitochondrial outer membrane transport complex Sam37/metaxin N-terminal domain-containing protein n=1 Tax=Monosiga brevicollis TaxID=81824 RepID=A9V708_MONBE|nr:uncharacterized protein MONBRDRAFT_33709 [Monosiga brevicollis MX1]EDQ86708.1 predicted protein [Monosiga brevicollis MX1]|eukprot:XP_001748544.1 hypothetical protein [Monosiga brevicollis MX1]